MVGPNEIVSLMQSEDVLFIGICGGIKAWQMVAVEQHGNWAVNLIKLAQKNECGLIRVVQSLGIGIQI